jgi:hypothetical protein
MTRRPNWAGACAVCANVGLALVCASAQAQGAKKDEQAGLALLILPLWLVVVASLQTAALLVVPRFSRRCATAVRRYRWQTGLAGLATFLGVLLVCALLSAATKNQQVGGVPFVIASLLATIGGVGVSTEVGRWALRRLQTNVEAHPVTEVLSGACLVFWGCLIVPIIGWAAWIVASWLSMGAFVMALVRGAGLDESAVARPTTAPSAPGPQPSAVPSTPTSPPTAAGERTDPLF